MTSILTNQQEELLEFVKIKHGEQKRKYTGEPYWTHCLAVGEDVRDTCKAYLGLEVGLCHDLFEDTDCAYSELFDKLIELDYSFIDAEIICTAVDDLTDRFTKEFYPRLNRKQRKEHEANRLTWAIPLAQTVKYADLINNTESIVSLDPNFARVYLEEKGEILHKMKGGSPSMRAKCLEVYNKAMASL